MATVIAKQTRNAGTYRTAPRDIDLLPDGTITATAIMDAADLADTNLLITLGVEANDTPGATAAAPGWYVLVSNGWQGGRPARDGQFYPPSVNFSTSVLTARRLRGLVMLSQRISVGLDVTVS